MSIPALVNKLHRLGHDTFRYDGPPIIYIDPWKLPAGSPAADQPMADLILVTHDHFDHCSPEDVQQLSKPGTVVIADPASAAKLPGARILRPGEEMAVGEVIVEAVPAYNVNKFRSPGQPFHPKSAGYNGYIITIGGERLYHAGDTDHIPEMAGYRCDVALLPVSGTYVMTADEAAAAAADIKPRVAVPMHYGDIVGGAADVQRFQRLCEQAGIAVVVV
jgi:L-ascorbate metabolism protein UlaG (beta-lactamase superfamily)